MKVLQVHGRYRSDAPSGENQVVDHERAALQEAGHEVELFERRSDDIATWSLARRATMPARVVWNPETHRGLTEVLARRRPQVVHLHNTFPIVSPSVLYACRDAGVPVVATIHNYKLLCASGDFFREGTPCHDCRQGGLVPAVRHGCYRGSRLATVPVSAVIGMHRAAWRRLVSAYIFISAAQRDLMAPLGLPQSRVFVKHNLVPHRGDRDVLTGPRQHLVAFLGRLDEAKGIPLLMQAWDRFRALRPESALTLAIGGAGPLSETVAGWARGRQDVEVCGLLSPPDAAALLRRAIAVVVPSEWEETFGLVAVEAMTAGAAPIAPARGSFPEILEDGTTGVLYTPGSVEALSAVFADVDRRPARFVDLGRRASAAVSAFDPSANVERLLDVYRFAAAHPATGDPGDR